ncbi:MAG: tRNA pseudouridine(13) synthase TruD [Paraglaciecola sp.]|nr:tRNA pseudouridine(13) synthase TruD [Paraglaciecola sp.]NCT47970.1 tRNA pseudouridine(13) synthase TruD [Paraglaciecola sp.]
MQTSHWAYLHPQPAATGRLKQHLSDFKVTEILGYEPSGQGEHIYLWVRKEGLNTAYLAEQIAKFARVPASSVTYAGRKDKYAVTEQWLSVHKPGKAEFDWQNLDLAGAEVLKAVRHDKKLRTGVLKGNVFDITVRELSSIDELESRLQCVAQQGVPNYYGSQRFGDSRYDPRGGNLVLAEKMLDGEVIRNRNKRSMAISAMRSWLFNEYLSQRIADGLYNQAMPGDVMILHGSASFFCAEQLDEQINQRLQTGDIQLSAPLWGKGDLASSGQALAFEHKLATQHHKVSECLAELGLKQERRAINLQPQQMRWKASDSTLNLQFILPAGAFATSVLREIVDIQPNYEVE